MNLTAAECYQICPRLRFLSYHLLGNGIERKALSLRAALEPHVLAGIEALLKGEDVEYAATHTYADYLKATAPRGLVTEEDQHEALLEQAVLVERIVRGFAASALRQIQDLCGSVALRFIVAEMFTPERVFLDTHSMATLELASQLGSQHGNGQISLQYIVVGDQHATPLLRGWQHPVSRQWYPAPEFRDSRTGRITRVGPEWKELPTWKLDQPTSADWVKFLNDKGTLSKLFPSVVVEAPSAEEVQEWKDAVAFKESVIAFSLTNGGSESRSPLHISFPKHRHSCGGCQFQTACFDPKFDLANPLAGGNFRKKVL